MIYFENISYDEIAESMNISVNMVRSHRARGLEIAHPPYSA
jgi:DNA-directed RNA polymerase specialized sigma24 family protein